MSDVLMRGPHYDQYLSRTDRDEREEVIASNDAFVAAMQKAIRRGREKDRAGTFVDTTPPIHARRIRGDVVMSPCGSPAAMCIDFAEITHGNADNAR